LDVGNALREAREQSGVTLAEIRDRTGISWQHLEALETMDVARLPDQRTVVTAARRYSEVVGLDPSEVCATALRAWQDEHWREGETQVAPPAPGDTGTQAHLRAFTQTAEIPIARAIGAPGGGAASEHFVETDAIPITSRPHPKMRLAPRWLEAMLGLTALLLLLGAAGLAVHQYKPQWLADIHLAHGHSPAVNATTGSVTPNQSAHSSRASHTSTSASRALVTQTASGTGSASVTVHAKSYQVVISAQKPCWIDATIPPGGSGPVFMGILQAGDTKTLAPVQGELSIEFGASFVIVQIQIAGKTVAGWSFTPPTAPLTLSFTTSPGS
jgi:cytoskeletal protein RodZ